MHAPELLLLALGRLGLLASEPALGAGLGHALSGPEPNEIRLELGEGCQDVEEHPAHGVVRVVRARAELEAYAAADELVGDGTGVRKGASEAVELGDDQGVADALGAVRSESLNGSACTRGLGSLDKLLVHLQ